MGSTLALPALIANEVDVIQVSAAPVITASLRGFDVVFIAGMLNTMIWDLYARPEIKSARTVERKNRRHRPAGKPGGLRHAWSLCANWDSVHGTFSSGRSAADPIQVVSALQSGQIAAGAAAPPVSFHIERSGFHSLASTLDQPYQNVGLVIRRGRMNELAPRLVPLLRSVREGIDRFYADKPFTLKVIPKYTRDSDPDIIERTYEFYRKAGFRRELMISEPGMRGMLNFLSESVPEAKKAEPAQFFDDRFVRQMNSRQINQRCVRLLYDTDLSPNIFFSGRWVS